MKIDQHATVRPFRCAVLPQIGNSNSLGFIDTGSDLDLEHVYVSFEAVFEMARMLGWHPPVTVRELQSELASLTAELDQVKADLAESERTITAIDFLGSKDFVKRNKPGRKPKTEVTT